MKIGIPKEIKKNEYRVAIIPSAMKKLVRKGHEVFVEKNAGIRCGFTDEDYEKNGAKIYERDELFANSEMIYKVKEILPPEYKYMRENLIIFTYLHSNANPKMTKVLLDSKVIAISYEDIEDMNGEFPLLKPMSEIAGIGGFIAALNLCQSIAGGPGLLLARVHGVYTPIITIIGAGNSGMGAAELAANLGNKVKLLNRGINKLQHAKNILPPNVELLVSNRKNLKDALKVSDVIINCVLWSKTAKGHLISREDLKLMKKTAIIVDVSCDEGGAIETSRPTSHDDPIYYEENICHYAVDNIPSAFSKTASELLSAWTLPYAIRLADKGVVETLKNDEYFRKGLCFYKGNLTLKETADRHSLEYIDPLVALNKN